MRMIGVIAIGIVLTLSSCGAESVRPAEDPSEPQYALLDECPYPAPGGLAAILHDPALIVAAGVIESIGPETKYSNIYGEYLGRVIKLEEGSDQTPAHMVHTERISEPSGAATSIDVGSLVSGQTVVLLSHADKGAVPIVMAVAVTDDLGTVAFPGRCDTQFRQEIKNVLASVDAASGRSATEALQTWLDLVVAGRDDTDFVQASSVLASAAPNWESQPVGSRSLAPDAVPDAMRSQIDVRAIFFDVHDGTGQTLMVSTASGVSAASKNLDGTIPSEAYFVLDVDDTFRVQVADASGIALSTQVLVELPLGDLESTAGYVVTGSLANGRLLYASLTLDDVAKRLGITIEQVLEARTRALAVAADGE